MDQLNYLFSPRNIAVIGASRCSHKIGYSILENIIRCGFKGDIYPVNHCENEILGLRCYSGIHEIDEPIDLAIIVLPAERSKQVVQECGEAGVKGVIVLSSGLKDNGAAGSMLEQKLVEICRHYGMRMVGPNCVGLMDTHIQLNASLVSSFPQRGNISFISQSGSMFRAILDWSLTEEIGFSRFISTGNQADLDEIEYIKSCAADPNTKVILCYIEDIVNGEKFIRVCREVSKKKPVIVLTSGNSALGAQTTSSLAGALLGGERAYEAAFQQCGVIRAKNINELFDMANAFSTQPLTQGNRVAILTNSGGPAIVATDAIVKAGLEMAELTQKTINLFRENMPAEANIHNPVDLLGDAQADRFSFALEILINDGNVDGIITIVGPSAVNDPEKILRVIADVKRKYPHKPLLVVCLGGKSMRYGREILVKRGVPAFTFPESSVNAFEAMVKYARYKKKLPVPTLRLRKERPFDKENVKALFENALKDNRMLMFRYEAAQVMEAYGIPVNRIELASSEEEASYINMQCNYPVPLNTTFPEVKLKANVKGIGAGLCDIDVEGQARQMIMCVKNRYTEGIEGQKMGDGGVEVIIGMIRNIQFGPLIYFGLGGIYYDLLQDFSFRLASTLISRQAIEEMINETMAGTLLRGYRGHKSMDLDLLIETIFRFARLAEDYWEISEMVINPFHVYTNGAVAQNIKIMLKDRNKQ